MRLPSALHRTATLTGGTVELAASRPPLAQPAGMRTLILPLLTVAFAAACGDDDAGKIQVDTEVASFFAEHDSIASIRTIGADTLSDSARVLRLIPEPDGRSMAVLFADPARGVSAGLALLEPERQRTLLVWPDSVGAVWWSGEHRLAFESRTGTAGVHAIVDVHADSLEHLEAAHDTTPPSAVPTSGDLDAARARATAYIDSIRGQPEGVPQQGQLRYMVTVVEPSPRDSVAAFYVAARGRGDDRVNPAWYLLHLPSGRIAPIDSVTGPASALPADAAAWTRDGGLLYAKGSAVHRARVAAATKTLQ